MQEGFFLSFQKQLSPVVQATMDEKTLLDIAEAFVGGDAHIAPLIIRHFYRLSPVVQATMNENFLKTVIAMKTPSMGVIGRSGTPDVRYRSLLMLRAPVGGVAISKLKP